MPLCVNRTCACLNFSNRYCSTLDRNSAQCTPGAGDQTRATSLTKMQREHTTLKVEELQNSNGGGGGDSACTRRRGAVRGGGHSLGCKRGSGVGRVKLRQRTVQLRERHSKGSASQTQQLTHLHGRKHGVCGSGGGVRVCGSRGRRREGRWCSSTGPYNIGWKNGQLAACEANGQAHG